jgi:hypothetical protein
MKFIGEGWHFFNKLSSSTKQSPNFSSRFCSISLATSQFSSWSRPSYFANFSSRSRFAALFCSISFACSIFFSLREVLTRVQFRFTHGSDFSSARESSILFYFPVATSLLILLYHWNHSSFFSLTSCVGRSRFSFLCPFQVRKCLVLFCFRVHL